MNLELNSTETVNVYKAIRLQINILRVLNNRMDSSIIQNQITNLENVGDKLADELGIHIHPKVVRFSAGWTESFSSDQFENAKKDLIKYIEGEK